MKFRSNPKGKQYGKTVVIHNIIDGKELLTKETFAIKNASYENDTVGMCPNTPASMVEQACKIAKKAFKAWRDYPAPKRSSIIQNAGRLMEENKEYLSKLVTRECGKTLKEARGSVQEAIDTCTFFVSEGRRLYGQTVPSELPNKELFAYRRPKGVTAIITAGNFPVAIPTWKIVPSLLCGNTVVWKPSSDVSTCAYALAKLFVKAGVPAGVLNVIFGKRNPTGDTILKMVDKGYINKISFTGSANVGRKIGEVAGRNLILPSLELGGKNPIVVMEDADLDLAVEGAIWATYGTGGQRCTSCGNIILHKKIAKQFKKKFMKTFNKITIGNPNIKEDVLYGPFMCKRWYEHFMKHFEWGKADGAKLLSKKNGRITKANKPASFKGNPETGYYCFPTIWDNVKPHMKIAQEEIFGPTTNFIEVNSVNEAIDAANASPYGLASAMYTNSRLYAYKFKTNIEAGIVNINNSTIGAENGVPFGGVKSSGNGTRECGIWVLDSYTYWQAVNEEMSGKLQLAQMDVEYSSMKKDKLEYKKIFSK